MLRVLIPLLVRLDLPRGARDALTELGDAIGEAQGFRGAPDAETCRDNP